MFWTKLKMGKKYGPDGESFLQVVMKVCCRRELREFGRDVSLSIDTHL